VLLSQIVERYGRDLRPRVLLSGLLEQLQEVPGLERIRFLTSYPGDFGATSSTRLPICPRCARTSISPSNRETMVSCSE